MPIHSALNEVYARKVVFEWDPPNLNDFKQLSEIECAQISATSLHEVLPKQALLPYFQRDMNLIKRIQRLVICMVKDLNE